jgi:hypothetical protein
MPIGAAMAKLAGYRAKRAGVCHNIATNEDQR